VLQETRVSPRSCPIHPCHARRSRSVARVLARYERYSGARTIWLAGWSHRELGGSMTSLPDGWKPDELSLRRKEIHNLRQAGLAQALASLATVAAVVVALYVALQGQQSLKNATQYDLQQAQDNQFSTALTSLGSSDTTERIAGLVLLRLNAADRLTPKSSAVFGKKNAYSYYTTALEIFSGYLSSHGREFLASVGSGHGMQSFGPGYGTLPPPGFTLDIQYAIDEVGQMLDLRKQVGALANGTPAFDMANDELYQETLYGMNFSWINTFMYGIDLRGTDMEKVHFGLRDDLKHSYLQCADLSDANLKEAKLQHADLRGADLAGADLQYTRLAGADLQGADVNGANFAHARMSGAELKGMYGTATGLPMGVVPSAANPPSQSSCLTDKHYWDTSGASPSPISSPSAKPSPSATRKQKSGLGG
jgi:Pentapeptide repeats (8 copies)